MCVVRKRLSLFISDPPGVSGGDHTSVSPGQRPDQGGLAEGWMRAGRSVMTSLLGRGAHQRDGGFRGPRIPSLLAIDGNAVAQRFFSVEVAGELDFVRGVVRVVENLEV